MRLGKKNTRNKFLYGFLVSYILILLIPLAFAALSYSQTVKVLEKEALENNLLMLEQSRDILDKRLEEIDSMVTQIALNSKIINFMHMDELTGNGEGLYRQWDAWRDLKAYRVTNNFIYNYFLLFKNSGAVITSDNTYTISRFYGQTYQLENMEYKQWYSTLFDNFYNKVYWPSAKVTLDDRDKKMITYLQSLPIELSKQSMGVIMVLIDKDEVFSLFKKTIQGDAGNIQIFSRDGNIVASANDRIDIGLYSHNLPTEMRGYKIEKLAHTDMLVSYTQSPYNGWRYVVAVPANIVLQKVNYIKNSMLIFTALWTFMGILTALVMANRNARPLNGISKIVRQNTKVLDVNSKNEYDFLRNAISNIIRDDVDLRNTMEEQRPVLQAALLYRLIRGGFNNENDAVMNMKNAGLCIEGKYYTVLLVKINGHNDFFSPDVLEELNMAKMVIKNTLGGLFTKAHPVDVDEDEVAFILAMDCMEDEYLQIVEALVAELDKTLCKELNLRLNYTVGKAYVDLMDISVAYNEAKQILDWGSIKRWNEVLWSPSLSPKSGSYYYPLDMELRLINLIKVGDREEVLNLLTAIFKENYEERQMSCEMIKYLLDELKGTIIKALGQITIYDSSFERKINSMMGMIDKNDTIQSDNSSIKELMLLLCDSVSVKKRQKQNEDLKSEILNYIHHAYPDQGLCLYSVASKFNLTEDYLSNFIKLQLGESFSAYVEKKRLDKACELLSSGGKSIEEVAELTGYSSSRAFRRAFKRCFGITPTDYKGTL